MREQNTHSPRQKIVRLFCFWERLQMPKMSRQLVTEQRVVYIRRRARALYSLIITIKSTGDTPGCCLWLLDVSIATH